MRHSSIGIRCKKVGNRNHLRSRPYYSISLHQLKVYYFSQLQSIYLNSFLEHSQLHLSSSGIIVAHHSSDIPLHSSKVLELLHLSRYLQIKLKGLLILLPHFCLQYSGESRLKDEDARVFRASFL